MASAPPDSLRAILEHARAARRLVQPSGAEPSLVEFVERTTAITLHSWQRDHLCPLLERFHTEHGLRVLIHGPPQFGKSIVKTKRFPAWGLGKNPLRRIVLAGYNIDHTRTQFAEQVRNTMLRPDFAEMFPGVQIPKNSASGEFSTLQRIALNDGQDSVVALGLQTGFTGKGVGPEDWLLMDDPYASPEEAHSEAINERTWRFWTEGAKNRVHPDANVALTFHRYHEDDIAGRLLSTGKWLYVRFPGLADRNEDQSDPTGRVVPEGEMFGEPLSPLWTKEAILEIKETNPKTFYSQWQGKPRPDEGALCKREWFQTGCDTPRLIHWVRYWDLATTTKTSGDWTVGILIGIGEGLQIYVRDMVRMRAEWPDVSDVIVQTTSKDSLMCQREGASYAVGMDARATQQGFVQDLARNAMFERIPLHPDKMRGDKIERSNGWRNRGRISGIKLCGYGWDQQGLIKEGISWQGLPTDTDDIIDGMSGGYALLWQVSNGIFAQKVDPRTIPGTMANLDALTGEYDDDDD